MIALRRLVLAWSLAPRRPSIPGEERHSRRRAQTRLRPPGARTGHRFPLGCAAGLYRPLPPKSCHTRGRTATQIALLAQQIEAMDDGGTVVISVPATPSRCPPASL